jgi:hypothetical protein
MAEKKVTREQTLMKLTKAQLIKRLVATEESLRTISGAVAQARSAYKS